jgi:RNA polymerase sigma factor (sigma-70 family)
VNRCRGSGQVDVMDNLPDAEVIRASCEEAEAFTAVFDRRFDPIRAYLVRRLGSSVGDELAAEVFVRGFELRRRYDPDRGELRAWLFGIAANLIRRHRRDERRRLQALARMPIAAEPPSDADSDRRVDAEQQRGALIRGLARLSQRDREVLLMFVWAELSYEQIAQALDLPIGTVRSRISRARRLLRRELDRPFGEERKQGRTSNSPMEVCDEPR